MDIPSHLVTLSSKNILGLDPSLRNWGKAAATLVDGKLTIIDCGITTTKNSKTKTIKQNKSDIDAALLLHTSLIKAVKWADVICIEVPHGSQSSRAMVSYGVCVALIAVLSHANSNVVHVSANDVKAIVRQDKSHKPTKEDVIKWVRAKHPEANLPRTLSAEHICDAIVAIHAGMKTTQFKELICKSN